MIQKEEKDELYWKEFTLEQKKCSVLDICYSTPTVISKKPLHLRALISEGRLMLSQISWGRNFWGIDKFGTLQ